MLHMSKALPHTTPTLPIPEPTAWFTIGGAAHLLGVHPATVRRWIKDRVLTAHAPIGAPDEKPVRLLFAPDVHRLGEARGILKGDRDDG